jgi:hypothetical protein
MRKSGRFSIIHGEAYFCQYGIWREENSVKKWSEIKCAGVCRDTKTRKKERKKRMQKKRSNVSVYKLNGKEYIAKMKKNKIIRKRLICDFWRFFE